MLEICKYLCKETLKLEQATSALDNETQTKIQEAIYNLKENYTIVIIAYRLSNIMNCDNIFFMQNGNIINEGTHKTLLKECKSYKELYEYEINSNN